MLHRILLALSGASLLAGPPAPPSGWQDGYVMANGVRIHYWRSGGGKPVMVLLHGSSDDGLCWTNFAREFTNRYDVILWDARGHGLSDAPNTIPSQEAMVEDLAAFLRALNLEKPILMGHSMGSGTVAWLASRYPEIPRAIVLEDPNLSPGGYPRAGPEQRAKQRMNILARNNMSFEQLVEGCMKSSPKWGRNECEIWAPSKQRHHPNTALSIPSERPPMAEMLKKIVVPALILKADATGEARMANEKAASLLVKGRIVHVTGAGHNVRRENKAMALDATNAFLSSLQ